MKTREGFFHVGELTAQSRYNKNEFWPDSILNEQIHEHIDPISKNFIESLPFFFIGTSNQQGECDVSFRGIDKDFKTLSAAKVESDSTLIFPDLPGNNLYNSLGNILVNPNIGMLFIDFTHARRLRINGKAEIINHVTAPYLEIWPSADRLIRVTTQQVYANCARRIHTSTEAHFFRRNE